MELHLDPKQLGLDFWPVSSRVRDGDLVKYDAYPAVPPAYELVAIEAASALEPIIDPGPVASPPESLSLSHNLILFSYAKCIATNSS